MMVVTYGLGLASSFPPRAVLPQRLWCYEKGYVAISRHLPSALVAGTSGNPTLLLMWQCHGLVLSQVVRPLLYLRGFK
jgi:hypothetical protein